MFIVPGNNFILYNKKINQMPLVVPETLGSDEKPAAAKKSK